MTSRRPAGALLPAQAVLRARDLLVGQGLDEVARSAGHESVYLCAPDAVLTLRISNHRRTAGRRRRSPGVLHSLVFTAPRSERQVELAVEQALRDYRRLLASCG